MATKRYAVELTLAELHAAQSACAGWTGARLKRSAAQQRADDKLCEAIAIARLANTETPTQVHGSE